MRLIPPLDLLIRSFAHNARGARVAPCLALLGALGALAAEGRGRELHIVSPQPWQVVQRRHVGRPEEAGRTPGGSAEIRVVLVGADASTVDGIWEIRVGASTMDAAQPPRPAPWQPLNRVRPLDATAAAETVAADIVVPAGGWYRIEIRVQGREGATQLAASVEPVGVGEVFLVAGQSYATNTNDERLQVMDPRRRVAAYDVETGTWRVADDPQPAPDHSEYGSIWPPVGDALAGALDVPIGFANVAVKSTSSAQWMPGGRLSTRLQRAGRDLGDFRAVLWQQGESDVLADTPAADYIARLEQIRLAAVEAWGFAPPWICALSTHHPTVYRKPEAERRIREAIMALGLRPGFVLGPDTDQLRGENRGGPQSRRHFSALGQRNAARLWTAVLEQQIGADR